MESVNNIAILCGAIVRPPKFSHMGGTDKYMTFPLEIERLSGTCDVINVIAREEALAELEVTGENRLYITGEVRSFNNKAGEGSRLVITVFAKKMEFSDEEDRNSIRLNGVICK
ncbi:MAG: single-stranded DNA-binding protein, partial [Clostridiales bacterium]|nr:single-stranded DNA-binding protein [Clostridiales bacterium]